MMRPAIFRAVGKTKASAQDRPGTAGMETLPIALIGCHTSRQLGLTSYGNHFCTDRGAICAEDAQVTLG